MVTATRAMKVSGFPRPLVCAFIAAIALAYAAFIYLHGSPFAAGSDSSGYLNSARLLARGEFTSPIRTFPTLAPPAWDFFWQEPFGFKADNTRPRMVPTYPTGLPIHLLLAAPLVGWEKAARLVNVLNVLAAGALLYALGRQLALSRPWSLVAIAFLWASPIFIFNSLQPLTDALSLTWALAMILMALKSRTRWTWGFAAGAAFGMAVLIRPTNVVLLVPLLLSLAWSWRALLATTLGGLPCAAWLFFYNARTYGSAFTTGYGDMSTAFDQRFLIANLAHFTFWVPLLISLPLAIAAACYPWTKRAAPTPRTIATLAAWLGVFVVFYATYFCASETWWYLRFLLPGFPAVILAGLLVGQAWRTSPPWLLIALCLAGQVVLARNLHVTAMRDEERRYVLAARWLNTHVPPGSVIIGSQLSGALHYYSQFTFVRTELLTPAGLATLRSAAGSAAEHPIYTALFRFENSTDAHRRLGGTWEPVTQIADVEIARLLPTTP